MADYPGWLLQLVAAVEVYEDEHAEFLTDRCCFSVPLSGVPAEVRVMARGYAQGRREAAE